MKNNKTAVQYGIIGMLLITIYNVILLVMNPEYAFSLPAYLAVVIMIITMCVAVLKTKKENDNYINFKTAFSTVFVIAVVAAIGNIIYSNLVMPLILPNYIDVIKTVMLKNMDWWFSKFNAPQDVKDKAIDEALLKLSKMGEIRIVDQIQAFIGSTLINSFFGVIIALILKSKGENPNEIKPEIETPAS